MTQDNTQNFEDFIEDDEEEQVETISGETNTEETAPIDSSDAEAEELIPQDEVSDGEPEITAKTTTQEEEFEFPQDWSEEQKALFGGLSTEQKTSILNINKGFQSDYTKKTQSLAEEKRNYENDVNFARDIKGVFNENEKLFMQGKGYDEKQAVNMAVANWRMENQDPMTFINQVAQRNGIDLHQEAIKLVQAQQEMTPEQQQLNSAVMPLQQQVQALQQQLEDNRNNAVGSVVDRYVNMVDETGQPKYPHLDSVEGRMANELTTMGKNHQTLTQEDWDNAYNNACYADPTIRATLLAKEQSVVNEVERKKADAIKALGAGKTVKTSAGAGNKSQAESFEDFLEQ